jgi:hypothetical protein
MGSSITNKMQRYTVVFITINALHVSGGSSAHHQELKTVYTSSGNLLMPNRQKKHTNIETSKENCIKNTTIWYNKICIDKIPDAVYTVLSS